MFWIKYNSNIKSILSDILKWSVKNPRFDYEEPVFFLVDDKKQDKKRFLRNLFVETYEKDPRANIGFPGKITKIIYVGKFCSLLLYFSNILMKFIENHFFWKYNVINIGQARSYIWVFGQAKVKLTFPLLTFIQNALFIDRFGVQYYSSMPYLPKDTRCLR